MHEGGLECLRGGTHLSPKGHKRAPKGIVRVPGYARIGGVCTHGEREGGVRLRGDAYA
jgi:hypothetical protein